MFAASFEYKYKMTLLGRIYTPTPESTFKTTTHPLIRFASYFLQKIQFFKNFYSLLFMSGRDIYLSPKGDPTMYILTHKQSKGISSITEYEKLSILRNWRNKILAVNSFKYRTIKGGVEGGQPKDHFRSQGGRGGPERA